MNKWDRYYLDMAKFVSKKSRDPSTKCGSVIVDNKYRVISIGFNGFARGVNDYKYRYDNRDLKYKLVIHSELNSVLFAKRDLTDCILYVYPFSCCSRCASVVIQSGITKVISPKLSEDKKVRWAEDLKLSRLQFKEAGVKVVEVNYD